MKPFLRCVIAVPTVLCGRRGPFGAFQLAVSPSARDDDLCQLPTHPPWADASIVSSEDHLPGQPCDPVLTFRSSSCNVGPVSSRWARGGRGRGRVLLWSGPPCPSRGSPPHSVHAQVMHLDSVFLGLRC